MPALLWVGTRLLLLSNGGLTLDGPGSRGGSHLGLTSPVPFFSRHGAPQRTFRRSGGQPKERVVTAR